MTDSKTKCYPLKIITLYTDEPAYYVEHAARFRSMLKNQGWDENRILIQPYKARKCWTDNINLKAQFIKSCMARFPDEALLWVDVDAEVQIPPLASVLTDADILAFPKSQKHSKRAWQIAALCFMPTSNAHRFAERWEELTCSATFGGGHQLLTDEYFFDLAYREMWQSTRFSDLGGPSIQGGFHFKNGTTGNAGKVNKAHGYIKHVKCFWARSPNPGNFGDLLTPHFIERELGVPPSFSKTSDPEAIMGAGSIIRFAQGCKIWGSGIFWWADDVKAKISEVRAVRGPYTAAKFGCGSIQLPQGDPGILLPFFNPKPAPISGKKPGLVGIVPHYVHWDVAKNLFKDDPNIRLINPLRSNPFHVADEIAECTIILSSSLHGLVAAQAYGIPWSWINFPQSKRRLDGDGVKFYDFFGSLGTVEQARPGCFDILKEADIQPIIKDGVNCYLPSIGRTKDIANRIWKVCPFNLVNLVGCGVVV